MADALLAATIPPSKILGGNWVFFFNFPFMVPIEVPIHNDFSGPQNYNPGYMWSAGENLRTGSLPRSRRSCVALENSA